MLQKSCVPSSPLLSSLRSVCLLTHRPSHTLLATITTNLCCFSFVSHLFNPSLPHTVLQLTATLTAAWENFRLLIHDSTDLNISKNPQKSISGNNAYCPPHLMPKISIKIIFWWEMMELEPFGQTLKTTLCMIYVMLLDLARCDGICVENYPFTLRQILAQDLYKK